MSLRGVRLRRTTRQSLQPCHSERSEESVLSFCTPCAADCLRHRSIVSLCKEPALSLPKGRPRGFFSHLSPSMAERQAEGVPAVPSPLPLGEGAGGWGPSSFLLPLLYKRRGTEGVDCPLSILLPPLQTSGHRPARYRRLERGSGGEADHIVIPAQAEIQSWQQ